MDPEVTEKQKKAFQEALKALGVIVPDHILEIISLPDVRSIYNCIALNVERGFDNATR